jgi:hypothetical protein
MARTIAWSSKTDGVREYRFSAPTTSVCTGSGTDRELSTPRGTTLAA